MDPTLARRFEQALPRVRGWIEELRAAHAPRATAVADLGFGRIPQHFPAELLRRARVAAVDEVPFPPLAELGVPELDAATRRELSGVTFGDLFFVRRDRATESLHFHELVHVVQWDALGWDRFLLAYGVGLATRGYRDSPLEEMAYELAADFDAARPLPDLVARVTARTEAVWADVAAQLRVAD